MDYLIHKGYPMWFIFLIASCLSMNVLVAARNFTYEELLEIDNERISLIETKEFPNAIISYVKIDKTPYIVKQKRIVKKQTLSPILDALAAWIAQPLAIAHGVQIIPAQKEFPGKNNDAGIALLLTIAPGKTVSSQPKSKYYHLALKQRGNDELADSNKWLTEEIIDQITWHEQLPILTALDVFISNTGRHRSNLFYDPSRDSFCAIDMDHCYRLNLPSKAIAQLSIMILRKKIFTRKEVKSLRVMRQTLQLLHSKYSANEIANKLHFFFKQGCMNYGPCLLQAGKKLKEKEHNIRASYHSTAALIKLLDEIVETFARTL